MDRGSLQDIQHEDSETQSQPLPPVLPLIDDDAPLLKNDENCSDFVPVIEDIKIAREFINALKGAKLEHNKIDEDTCYQIKHPTTTPLVIENPTVRLSLDLYLAIGNASEEMYTAACNAIRRRFPNEELFTFYKVKWKIEELTRIMFIFEDMCINGCLGFTGPYSDKTNCQACAKINMKHLLRENRFPGSNFK